MKQSVRFRGPSLVLLAVVHILLFVANLVAVASLRHGASYVNPFAGAVQISAFFVANPAAVRIGNFLIFGSAVPLGLFAVTASSLLRHLGVRAAGTNIALFGGVTASIALMLCGCFGWVLSVHNAAALPPLAQALSFLAFLWGGAAYAVAFGLLAAGVSITAWFTRLMPGSVSVLGMVVAVAGELASLSLVTYPANYFIPINRYLGFIWMVAAAITLNRSRKRAESTQPVSA